MAELIPVVSPFARCQLVMGRCRYFASVFGFLVRFFKSSVFGIGFLNIGYRFGFLVFLLCIL